MKTVTLEDNERVTTINALSAYVQELDAHMTDKNMLIHAENRREEIKASFEQAKETSLRVITMLEG